MADQNKPARSPKQAPDPARSYERAKPEAESGMGRLDSDLATPSDRPDRQEDAVKHRQSSRQINTEDAADASMHDEEPLGEDQMPTEATEPRRKRHPRIEGKGGTP